MNFSVRRSFLRAVGAVSLTGCAIGTTRPTDAVASTSKRTPAEPMGPFYPVNWSGDIDGNLLRIDQGSLYQPDIAQASDSKPGALQAGEQLLLSGKVMRADGAAAVDAMIDIWQTDQTGRYRHPDDAGEAPAQRGFQGYGRVKTDSSGRYEFLTVKPAHYGSRPPHIHFRVVDGDTTLITQMYFSGENAEQGVFARIGASIWASDREMLTITPSRGKDGTARGLFNIYL